MEPKTPLATAQEFDHNAYTTQLKKIKSPSKTDNLPETIKPDSAQYLDQNQLETTTDTLLVTFNYGQAKVDVEKTPQQKLVFLLHSDTARQLDLEISSNDSLSHLKIDQIIDPENQVFGPFDAKTKFIVDKKGMHQIILNPTPSKQIHLQAKLIW